MNPLTLIDFYKADHRRQYPAGTDMVYSNFTPRSTKYLPYIEGCDRKIVFFGLQFFIKNYLMDMFNYNFFMKDKDTVVKLYKRRMDTSLGKDAIPVDHIEALHDLGYLPIKICALPEGSCVNERVPVLVLYNTHKDFFWLVNYIETILSCYLWKACTSATIARMYRQILNKFSDDTVGDRNFVPFQAHDFSARGMSGIDDMVKSGAAHLLSFVGTDTVSAIDFLECHYNADCEKELIGCSVPATEHSVMCMGSKDGERETIKRLITELYPKGIVSVVSDTWDFWNVITKTVPDLKDEIMNRDGKLVIRPDSGDPVLIICGDPDANEEHIRKGAIECLYDTFGGTITSKGYKQLDGHIGLIYGDSITLERCYHIMNLLKQKGFASSNVVLGVGSYTYQHVTRDTCGFAMKSTAGSINGELVEIFKKPKTDDGTKNSARGFIKIYKENGEFKMKDQCELSDIDNELKPVFEDGKLIVDQSLSQIREYLKQQTL